MAAYEDSDKIGLNTRLGHMGNNPRDFFGFVNPPVVRASTVLFPDAKAMADRAQKYTYGTAGTPTTDALTEAVNALENAAGTIAVPSGLAAVTVPLLAFLSAGDHLLMVDSVYYPTRRFCDSILKKLGIETEYYDPLIGKDIDALCRANTAVIFTESPGSNTFEVQDIPAISNIARQREIITMTDNTWATPLLFRPLDHGVDISIQAATKYPAGHSDILSGLVSANEKYWPQLWNAFLALGTCSGPEESYQVLRGLRTMGLRLERHGKSALELARWLKQQPGVARVLHPALEDDPGHALWSRDFAGSSGLFAIVLDGGVTDDAHRFLDALTYFGLGYSWGGYASLAVMPDLSDRTIAKAPPEGPVIRLQIGLENVEDLQADLEKGLKAYSSGHTG